MESRSPRTEKPDDKRQLVFVSLFIALVIIGISGFLGAGYLVAGALVPIAIVGALAMLAIGQLSTNQEGRFLVEDAREHGTVAPIEYWGKVAVVSGECPEGVTPREGDTFIVTRGGDVQPKLCSHAREAIFHAIAGIAPDEVDTAEPARHHDNDHHLMLEIHRAPSSEEREGYQRAA
jgi:uncharacterized repeat protein (TIGR04076 family)